MSYRYFTAGDIMDISAGLLNDYNKESYTYLAQIPFLQLAIQELQEGFELNNIPVSNNTSAVIPVDAGITEIGFVEDSPAPNLPEDLVEIQTLWYSARDQNVWYPMTKREFLPHQLEIVNINPLTYWAWLRQKITFLPAITDSDVKLDYIQTFFPDIADENTILQLINGRTVLQYRTAALAAQFIGENKSRADELNGFAIGAYNRIEGISIKAKQFMPVRRLPFRAAFKRRRMIS